MTDHQDLTEGSTGSVLDFSGSPSIERQAHEWMIRLDDQPTEEDRQAFKEWVKLSKEHRRAFEDVVDFWGEMDVLTQIVLPREEATVASEGLVFRLPWTQFRTVAAGCCCLLIALVAVFMQQSALPKHYTTAIGQQMTVDLEDGSSVLLNTNSLLVVDYSAERRRLTLVQGEAHFDVFHNPEIPFEVYAGNGLVRALGTAFSVRLQRRNVGVVVTEGTVEIDSAEQVEPPEKPAVSSVEGEPPPGSSSGTTESKLLAAGLQVKAGNQLVYDRDSIATIEIAEVESMDEQLSWHQGNLVFDGETLKQVVEEISRYTSLKIVIPEKKTRDIKIGGVFKIGDTDSFFEAIEKGFDIQVTEVVPDKVVHLSRKIDK